MKRFVLFCSMCMLALVVLAMPAWRKPFIVTQSDGSVLTLQLVGDETLHYYINVLTGEKMYLDSDGNYQVMTDAELTQRQSVATARRTEVNSARLQRLARNSGGALKSPLRIGTTSSNMTGSKKGLVILVNFSDKTMASAHTQSVFDNQFNKEGYTDGGHLGSVHDYFYDQSYGVFDLTFDVVGPVTVSNTMSYYGGNDSSGNDEHPATMVIEACKLADAAGTDFSDYDWDGDGEVDQVYVIYAGYGEAYGASSSTIWPHEWSLSSAKSYGDGTGSLTLDGVKIDTYACSCELSGTSGSTLNGIGTACHEFSHCLGFPDFYDTSYAGGFGMNAWDLMDAGSYNGPSGYGEVPAGYTSYERMSAGWLTPTELSSAATITGMKALGDSPEAYVIYNDKNEDEYILLENRQNSKWFKYVDTYTTPHGLLALHVDYDATAWNNDEPNNTSSHQRMSIIPASGTYGTKTTSSGQTYYTCTESQLKGHPFGGSGSKTSLTGTSNSSSGGVWFTACSTGSTTLNHEVTEITNASDGTISFLFDGGAVVDDGSRYTITYNAGSGTCNTSSWTQTDFLETTTLPSCTAPTSDWTFIGWSTTEVEEGSSCPSLYYANSTYQPTGDITFYAVYKSTSSGTSTATGDYVLVTSAPSDWSGEYLIAYPTTTGAFIMDGSLTTLDATSNYQSVTVSNNTISGTDNDQYNFTIAKSSTSGSYTIKSASGYYIGGSGSSNGITYSTTISYDNTISVSSNYADIVCGTTHLRFNNNTGQVRFRYFKSSSYSSQKSIQLYKKDGSSAGGTYATNPGADGLTTPTITFPSATQSILMGDTNDNYTATVTNSTGEVTYTSSDASVATVGPRTGRVVAKGVGTTVITANVASVSGVSKSASTSYKLTVSMPALSSIAVTTQPTKTTYLEKESFSSDGMVVTATYANGYTQAVTDYTLDPSTSVALTTDDKVVTVTYTEDGVTATTTVPITVNPLPKYTVSFNAGTGTCATTSLTEGEYQSGITLPSASGINEEWVFAGWAAETVDLTTTRPTLYLGGSTYAPTANTTLYAVYSRSETSGGSGNYELVTESLTDWSGDYILAYSSTVMADGKIGGKDGIGASSTIVSPGDNLNGTTIAAEWGDTYHFSLDAIDGGYLMRTQDNQYNYRTANSNGLDASDDASTASSYPINVVFNSSSDIDLVCQISSTTSSCPVFHYNPTATMFRFYASGGQSNVYLYKKEGSLLNVSYATSPTGTALVEPTISFAEKDNQTLLVGDSFTNVATAENTTGTITYTSSNSSVASVNKTTGEVTACGVGTATITAFVDAVAGVSKSATTTYDITVSMPALSGIEISTPATQLSFDEGDAFSISGLTLTATYENGYTQTLSSGYTSTPADGDAVSLSNTNVVVSYTEGDVTKTTSYDITVNELDKYTVTFNVNGNESVVAQTIANTGVSAPTVDEVVSVVDGAKVTYTFAGWTTSDITTETTSKPTFVTLTDGKYTPTEATTLYAVYNRIDGDYVKGFTLNLTYNSETYYVGAANSSSKRFDSSDSGITLYFKDGYLWYNYNGTAMYAYSKSSSSADIVFTSSKSTASNTWTMTENDGVATFLATTGKYLALNTTSTSIIRGYSSAYPYKWNITYTGDTFSSGTTSYYTCYPAEITIVTITELVKQLNDGNATLDWNDDGNYNLDDVNSLNESILKK